MPATAPISATGIDRAGTSVARQSSRNRKMIATTTITEISTARSTSCSAPEMKTESSLEILTSTPARQRRLHVLDGGGDRLRKSGRCWIAPAARCRGRCPTCRRSAARWSRRLRRRSRSQHRRSRVLPLMMMFSNCSGVVTSESARTLMFWLAPLMLPAAVSKEIDGQRVADVGDGEPEAGELELIDVDLEDLVSACHRPARRRRHSPRRSARQWCCPPARSAHRGSACRTSPTAA